jgi:hypothetical protein
MKKIIFLAGMLLPVCSYSQNADSSTRSKLITTSPKSGGVTLTYLVAPVKTGNSSFSIQQLIVDAGIPIYKNFKSKHPVLIRAGIRYQGLLLSNEKSISSTNFHAVTVPVLFNYSFSRAKNIMLIGTANVGSDFKQDVETKDIQYAAGIRMGFRQNRPFRYGVTLTYVRNYAGTYLVPIPDFEWAISKKMSLGGVLPARVSLKYQVSKAQSLGITTSVTGTMYRLNEELKDQYLHIQQSSAGFIYDLQFRQRWKISLMAGHTFTQKLETFNINQKVGFNQFGKLNDRVANVSYNNNSFLFQAGISCQF